VCLAVASTQVQYFRVGALDPDPERDTRRALWYSEELKLLGEPSLWEPTPGQNTESYRFLWLRSFQPDLSVRLDVTGDGTSSLTTKIARSKHSRNSGKLKTSHVLQVTKEQTTLFLATIEEHRFCNLPSAHSYRGLDGADWIIEGNRGGTYHVIDRWMPKDGDVRAIGFAMVNDLANLNISTKEN
jgi:hypothetical protein